MGEVAWLKTQSCSFTTLFVRSLESLNCNWSVRNFQNKELVYFRLHPQGSGSREDPSGRGSWDLRPEEGHRKQRTVHSSFLSLVPVNVPTKYRIFVIMKVNIRKRILSQYTRVEIQVSFYFYIFTCYNGVGIDPISVTYIFPPRILSTKRDIIK